MPRKTNHDGWEVGFRRQLLGAVGPDLTIGDHRGKMHLQLRLLDGTRQRVMLPYLSVAADSANALQRIVAIKKELDGPSAPSLAEANAISKPGPPDPEWPVWIGLGRQRTGITTRSF
jgi:hypothetical protein